MDKPRVTPEELAALLSSEEELSRTGVSPRKEVAQPAVSQVHISIELAHGLVEPGELISLRPGDVIRLGQSPTQPVNILIDDVFVACGRVLNIDDELCVEVLSFADDEDEPIKGPR